MKAAIKLPGLDWKHVDIENNFEEFQKVVGGNIELVPNLYTEAVMYCNEEGKLNDLDYNFHIFPDDESDEAMDLIVGPVIMLGPTDEEGLETDLTEEMFNKTLKCIEDY